MHVGTEQAGLEEKDGDETWKREEEWTGQENQFVREEWELWLALCDRGMPGHEPIWEASRESKTGKT